MGEHSIISKGNLVSASSDEILSGIGKDMASALAVNGDKVIICARRIEQIESAASEINVAAQNSGMSGEIIAIHADIGTKQGVIDFFEKCDPIIDKAHLQRSQGSS